MLSALEQLDKHRSQVHTRSGPASCIDTGGPGRAALFVHGPGTSSYLWRNVIGQLGGQRRCVAFDLPLHGQTPAAAGQDFSLPGLARFLADGCDALELTDVDLVSNDTGGAVSQVFAAGHPERLHTLTLTNCEAHDNLPPKALLPAVLLARMGLFARIAPRLYATSRGPANASTAAATRTSPACPTRSCAPGWNRCSARPNRPASSSA